jgi:hypothetical protein
MQEYASQGHGVVVLDDVLTPEALAHLRRVCLESTVWFDIKQSYFKVHDPLHSTASLWFHVQARLDDGLHDPIVTQAASPTKLFPSIER